MGTLFDSVIAQKRKYIIEELHKLNITRTGTGESLESLDYDRLKEELVLASFRQIDVEKDAGISVARDFFIEKFNRLQESPGIGPKTLDKFREAFGPEYFKESE